MKALTAAAIALSLAALPLVTLGTDRILTASKVIDLPDSSRLMVGSHTNLRVGSFDRTGTANATFILSNGIIRFKVGHSLEATSFYTFQTALGRVTVRGTEGDIESTPTELRVNLYRLGDARWPVVISMHNGRIYTLQQGQGIVIRRGATVASVEHVTPALVAPFAEFGTPDAPDASAGISGGTGAAGASGATGATIAAAAIVGAGALIALGSHGSTTHVPLATAIPSPTPLPTSAPTGNPTSQPSTSPTETPTSSPTTHPTTTPAPTAAPTGTPGPLPIIIQRSPRSARPPTV